MMLTLLVDHTTCLLSQLRGILCSSIHSSISPKAGAFANPGEVYGTFLIYKISTSKAEYGVMFLVKALLLLG